MKKENHRRVGSLAGSSISLESVKLQNFWHLFVRQTTVIEPEDPIRIGLRMMAHRNFGHLPVVRRDHRKELLGMISAQDVIDIISCSYHLSAEAKHANSLLSLLDESAFMRRRALLSFRNSSSPKRKHSILRRQSELPLGWVAISKIGKACTDVREIGVAIWYSKRRICRGKGVAKLTSLPKKTLVKLDLKKGMLLPIYDTPLSHCRLTTNDNQTWTTDNFLEPNFRLHILRLCCRSLEVYW